jgi:Zn-finger nucleic acid-binding protein
MSPLRLGEAELRECARCGGLWVNVETFERICADREQQAVVLGSASPAPAKAGSGEATSKVRYIPCPECGQLMNRVNFAHCSGVVVDICKGHGTWFDRDELAEIVGFIRGGGLEAARAREKRQLEDERRRLRQEQLAKAGATDYPHITADDRQATESGIVSVAGSLLKLLLD